MIHSLCRPQLPASWPLSSPHRQLSPPAQGRAPHTTMAARKRLTLPRSACMSVWLRGGGRGGRPVDCPVGAPADCPCAGSGPQTASCVSELDPPVSATAAAEHAPAGVAPHVGYHQVADAVALQPCRCGSRGRQGVQAGGGAEQQALRRSARAPGHQLAPDASGAAHGVISSPAHGAPNTEGSQAWSLNRATWLPRGSAWSEWSSSLSSCAAGGSGREGTGGLWR